jgi:hypothetical protein
LKRITENLVEKQIMAGTWSKNNSLELPPVFDLSIRAEEYRDSFNMFKVQFQFR